MNDYENAKLLGWTVEEVDALRQKFQREGKKPCWCGVLHLSGMVNNCWTTANFEVLL